MVMCQGLHELDRVDMEGMHIRECILNTIHLQEEVIDYRIPQKNTMGCLPSLYFVKMI